MPFTLVKKLSPAPEPNKLITEMRRARSSPRLRDWLSGLLMPWQVPCAKWHAERHEHHLRVFSWFQSVTTVVLKRSLLHHTAHALHLVTVNDVTVVLVRADHGARHPGDPDNRKKQQLCPAHATALSTTSAAIGHVRCRLPAFASSCTALHDWRRYCVYFCPSDLGKKKAVNLWTVTFCGPTHLIQRSLPPDPHPFTSTTTRKSSTSQSSPSLHTSTFSTPPRPSHAH